MIIPPPPIPDEYSVLFGRSMFLRAKGKPGAAAKGAEPGGPGGAATQGGPESTLALRGSALQDGEYIAFVEDMGDHAIRRVKAGDPIATGRLTGVTLDAVDYEAKGKVTHVAIGENLAGVPLPAPAPAPTTAPGGAGGGGGGPPGGPPGPPVPGMNGPAPPGGLGDQPRPPTAAKKRGGGGGGGE